MLSGFRILDLTDETGFLAGKILADLGADVVKIERPGGDRARMRGPHLHGVADPERSLLWLSLNTSKRGITLDLTSERGLELFVRLAGRCDAVIESGDMDALGIGAETMRTKYPRLAWCALTPFGRTGPYA